MLSWLNLGEATKTVLQERRDENIKRHFFFLFLISSLFHARRFAICDDGIKNIKHFKIEGLGIAICLNFLQPLTV